MTKYANYREQCTALREQLDRLLTEARDEHDTTIEYCLRVAGAMLTAADALIETREEVSPNATSHRGAACGASGGLPGCASNGDTEK